MLCRLMESRIRATPGVELDYAVIVDAETLQPLQRVQGKALVALAAKVGTTRLIDNVIIGGR